MQKVSHRSGYCTNLSNVELFIFITELLCSCGRRQSSSHNFTPLVLPDYLLSTSLILPAFLSQKWARHIQMPFQVSQSFYSCPCYQLSGKPAGVLCSASAKVLLITVYFGWCSCSFCLLHNETALFTTVFTHLYLNPAQPNGVQVTQNKHKGSLNMLFKICSIQPSRT